MGPPAQVDLVTRAAGIAVPPNQGSSSSLLEAVAAPPAQEGPVMRVLVTARRADPLPCCRPPCYSFSLRSQRLLGATCPIWFSRAVGPRCCSSLRRSLWHCSQVAHSPSHGGRKGCCRLWSGLCLGCAGLVAGTWCGHVGTMGVLGDPGGQGVTWATYKGFDWFCGVLISRSNQKLHEKSEPMVLRSAGDSAIITNESQ